MSEDKNQEKSATEVKKVLKPIIEASVKNILVEVLGDNMSDIDSKVLSEYYANSIISNIDKSGIDLSKIDDADTSYEEPNYKDQYLVSKILEDISKPKKKKHVEPVIKPPKRTESESNAVYPTGLSFYDKNTFDLGNVEGSTEPPEEKENVYDKVPNVSFGLDY